MECNNNKYNEIGLEKLANIELLCEPTDILRSSVIPIVKNDLDTEVLKVELPRFITELKDIIGHKHLTSNDIDLQLYDIYPNVKLLVTFLHTSFDVSNEDERAFSVMRRIHTYLRITMDNITGMTRPD